MVFSPLIAATATFALNAGLWFRRGHLAMVFSPLAASCCCRAENPFIPAVQISAAASAAIIRRIFEDFASGLSPKSITKRLNAEKVPGQRGTLWRDTAVRGHRTRGTGLLNNELYIGRLVWNRLRYVKDTVTGRRISRLKPKEEWIVTEVPDLRIIEDDLWQGVRRRQSEIDADPRIQSIKATRFWEQRRQTHLLTGLLRCGSCGGSFAAVGRDYLACFAARKLGTCQQKRCYPR